MPGLVLADTSGLPARLDPAPLRVEPEPMESARSLLLRVAARNLCSVEEMNRWLGLPAPSAPLSGDLTRAARFLGVDADRLERMGFEDAETGWVLGHKVPVDRLYRTVRRFCPDCLTEKPYYRRIWDLHQIDCCPIHSRQLADRCHECGAASRWVSQWSPTFCNCGASLDRPGASPIVGDRTGAQAIYLHCGLPAGGEGARLPAVFETLPLGSLLDLLFFFGRMDVIVANGNPDDVPRRLMLKDRSILNAGARIALGWPGSFSNLAERVRASRPEVPGVMKQYGYLHRFIERTGEEPYSGLLRDAYAAHLVRRGDIPARSWPDFLPSGCAPLQAMTPHEVQLTLGLGAKPFASLRKEPLWTGIRPLISTSNGVPQYAPHDVEALRTKVSRLVSPGVADKMLRLGRGRAELLMRVGLVEVHRWNRHRKNGQNESVDVADLENLIERIRTLAVDTAPARPIPFETLLAMAVARRVISYVDVIRSLLSGELRGHLADASLPGLSPLSFERADASDVLDRLSNPSRCRRIVLGCLKRRWGVTADAIHQLVAKGLLAEPERACAFVFDLSAVEAFEKEFTFDLGLARRRGRRPTEVRRALALTGILPVTTITVRGATAGVYRRRDLGPMT